MVKRRRTVFELKRCKNFYGNVANTGQMDTLLSEVMSAIKKCVNWSQSSTATPPTIIGKGYYSSVAGTTLKPPRRLGVSRRSRDVAIKIQTVVKGLDGADINSMGLDELKEALLARGLSMRRGDVNREELMKLLEDALLDGNLDFVTKEASYAEFLGRHDLGPKIYKNFYYALKDSEGTALQKYRVIFIMERFHNDAFGILTQYRVPVAQAASTFKQMLEIIEIITANNIFCRDVKPSNFVVNINQPTQEVMVRMIDFGGTFCQDFPPNIIENIREQAEELHDAQRRRSIGDLRHEGQIGVTLQPKLQTILAATQGKDDDYPKHLFTRIIQVSLILQVFKTMMWQLKQQDGNNNVQLCTSDLQLQPGPSKYCRYNKIVMQAALPIISPICSNHTELFNITETIINSWTLYEIFLHYVKPSKKNVNANRRREVVLREFKTLCFIDKWLRGERGVPIRPKPGKRAALSRWLRGVPTYPALAPPDTKRGGFKARKKKHIRAKRRHTKRRHTNRRKSGRSRSTRKKRH